MDEITFNLTITVDEVTATGDEQIKQTVQQIDDALRNIGLKASGVEVDIYDD